MTLQSSGLIYMSQINAEFGRGNNLNAYRGTTWYTDAGGSGTFSAGSISFYEFYGKRLSAPGPAIGVVFSVPATSSGPLSSSSYTGNGFYAGLQIAVSGSVGSFELFSSITDGDGNVAGLGLNLSGTGGVASGQVYELVDSYNPVGFLYQPAPNPYQIKRVS